MDQQVWTPGGKGRAKGQIAASDVVALAGFLKATGWRCLYGVNLGGAAKGATTPDLAAAEVAFVSQQLGPSLLGIEIGNECDLYGHAGNYFAGDWSLSRFTTIWASFRSAILKAAPGVAVTGPASALARNVSSWTVPFGKLVTKSQISLLTQHYYRGNGQSPSSTIAHLVTADPDLVHDLAVLKAGAQQIGVPFRIGECNSYFHGGASGVSNAYGSALWVVDFLFNCALGGASGVNLHGGGHGDGYTPIADTSGAIVGVRPEFYGVTFFTLAGQGALVSTHFGVGSLNATAYAVKTAAGGLNLVLVNKDPVQNLHVTATLPKSFSSADLVEMTQLSQGAAAPSLSATSGVAIQGAAIGRDGAFSPGSAYGVSLNGSNLQFYAPALSAVLVKLIK